VFGATVLSKLDERARATARQSSSEAARQRGAARPGRSRQKEHRTWAASPCLSISGYCRRAPRCEPWGCGCCVTHPFELRVRLRGCGSVDGFGFGEPRFEPLSARLMQECGEQKDGTLAQNCEWESKSLEAAQKLGRNKKCVARSRSKSEGETREGSSTGIPEWFVCLPEAGRSQSSAAQPDRHTQYIRHHGSDSAPNGPCFPVVHIHGCAAAWALPHNKLSGAADCQTPRASPPARC
jgi:hypothetical protein